jgi:hypothetical protein
VRRSLCLQPNARQARRPGWPMPRLTEGAPREPLRTSLFARGGARSAQQATTIS